MGWSSGSQLFDSVIETMQAEVPDEEVRLRIYTKLWEAFEDEDWDCPEDCLGADPVYDKLFHQRYPGYGDRR